MTAPSRHTFISIICHGKGWSFLNHVFHHSQEFSKLKFYLVLFKGKLDVFLPPGILSVPSILCPHCLSIRLFCYDLYVPKFYSETVLPPSYSAVGMSSHNATILIWRIFFHCFRMSGFGGIVWSYLDKFLVSLLSPVPSDLSPRVISFVVIVLPCSFRPNIFLCFSSVLSFSLVVEAFFFVFPVWFPIHVLNFCSCSLGGIPIF